MTLTRGVGNHLIRAAFRLLIGPGNSDLLSGYRVFNRRFRDAVTLRSSGFEIETELASEAVARQMRVVEIPIEYLPRIAGTQSKLRSVSRRLADHPHHLGPEPAPAAVSSAAPVDDPVRGPRRDGPLGLRASRRDSGSWRCGPSCSSISGLGIASRAKSTLSDRGPRRSLLGPPALTLYGAADSIPPEG